MSENFLFLVYKTFEMSNSDSNSDSNSNPNAPESDWSDDDVVEYLMENGWTDSYKKDRYELVKKKFANLTMNEFKSK